MVDRVQHVTRRSRAWCVVSALIVSACLLAISFVAIGASRAKTVVVLPDTTDSSNVYRDTTNRPWHEAAWNQIVSMNGVRISYIYYAEANEVNDGVVIKLENTQDDSVAVGFTIVFRSPSGEVADRFATTLAPYEMKTGGNDGLYWIPFRGGETIGEVGLRGVDIRRILPPPG